MKLKYFIGAPCGTTTLIYELPDGLQRVEVDDSIIDSLKVCGYDAEGKMYQGILEGER